jgi:hypothetical protein
MNDGALSEIVAADRLAFSELSFAASRKNRGGGRRRELSRRARRARVGLNGNVVDARPDADPCVE